MVSAIHNRVHDISQVTFPHIQQLQIQVSNMHLGEGGLNMALTKPFPNFQQKHG